MKYVVTVIEPNRNVTWFQSFDSPDGESALYEMAFWLLEQQNVHPLETELIDLECIYEDKYYTVT